MSLFTFSALCEEAYSSSAALHLLELLVQTGVTTPDKRPCPLPLCQVTGQPCLASCKALAGQRWRNSRAGGRSSGGFLKTPIEHKAFFLNGIQQKDEWLKRADFCEAGIPWQAHLCPDCLIRKEFSRGEKPGRWWHSTDPVSPVDLGCPEILACFVLTGSNTQKTDERYQMKL